MGSFFTTVKPLDAGGNELEPFRSDATMLGTYCFNSLFFLLLLFIVPFLLIGGFIHMTIGWRGDLKSYVRAALKRETSDAAKAVQIDEATEGDRFGSKSFPRSLATIPACLTNLESTVTCFRQFAVWAPLLVIPKV